MNIVDIGCDIFMVNKNNEEDVIIVQCKNYKNRNVCIEDLSGFFHLIALSHLKIKGIIMSNSNICARIINKLKLTDTVIFINLIYELPSRAH
jgi:predicted helicase